MLGFPGDTRGKESACQCRRHRRCGFDPWVRKIPLEEELETRSSVLAWTEEPGGLQSVGLQRARHDLATEHACTSLLRILSTAPELEDSGVGNSKITWELRGRTGLPFLSLLEAQLVESLPSGRAKKSGGLRGRWRLSSSSRPPEGSMAQPSGALPLPARPPHSVTQEVALHSCAALHGLQCSRPSPQRAPAVTKVGGAGAPASGLLVPLELMGKSSAGPCGAQTGTHLCSPPAAECPTGSSRSRGQVDQLPFLA